MSSIDRRVVAMQFDHAQFERGVRSTIDDMAALEQSLKLDNVGNNVEKIASKFNVLGAIGFAGLQRLTNGAIDLGKKMASALIDPLVEGGKRRALNIEQAKFQFEGLGLDIETAMDNALYAVKGTAFGLDEAAAAASQLAASGVELGTEMENSLRGISGLAAMTNSSYDDIANIFVKVAGQGRLMGDDLNRIGYRGINAAAMLAEAFDVTEEEIRKMVSNGEIGFEEFANAMDEAFGEQATKANDTFSGAMSNMRAALSRVGEMIWTPKHERARRFYNALTPVIDDVADSLGPMVVLYETLSRKGAEFWENFFGSIDASQLKKVLTPLARVIENLVLLVGDFGRHLKRAWDDIFGQPSETTWFERAAEWLWELRDSIAALRPSGQTLVNFQRTFAGLFAAFDIAWMVLKQVVVFLSDMISYIFTGSSGILEFTGNIGDWIVSLRDAMKEGEGLEKIFSTLGNVLKIPIDLLKGLVTLVKDFFTALTDPTGEGFKGFAEKAKQAFEPLGHLGERISEIWGGISPHFQRFFDWVAPLFTGLFDKMKEFGSQIGRAFRDADFSLIFDLVNTGVFATLALTVKKLIDGFSSLTNDSASIRDSITSIFTGVTDTLGAMQAQLKAGTLLKIAGAIGILAVSIMLIASIDPVALTISLGAIAVMFGELMGALALFNKAMSVGGGFAFAKMPVIATGLVILSAAVVVLSAAVKNLSDLDWGQMIRGLVGVASLMAAMAGFTHIVDTKLLGLITTATGMVILASAIRIVVTAVEKLGGMDLGKLAKGLVGVAAIMAAMAGFTQIAKTKWFSFITTATGMVILAAAVKQMYDAVKDFATMDWHSIGRGLAGMGGALALMVLALNFTPPSSALGALGILIAVQSLDKIAEAMERFSEFSWGEIGKSLVMLLGSLGLVVAAMALSIEGLPGALAFYVMAPALLTIASAMQEMGKMEWGEIGRATVMLLSSLTLIALGMALMLPALPGAVALIFVAGALAILAPILKLFGSMEWNEIGKSLVMLAGALGTIGLTSLILAPVVPIIAALAASITLLGIAIFGIGAGVFLFAAGLGALATSGALGIGFLIGLVDELIELIPKAMKKFGEGIVEFAGVIERGAPALMRAFEAIFTEWLGIIDRMSPIVAETLAKLLLLLLRTMADYAPQYADAGADLIVKVLEGIERNMDRIVHAGVNVVNAFILAMARELPRITDTAALGVIIFVNGVATSINNRAPQLRSAGWNLAFAIVDGMTGGMLSTIANSRIYRAATNLASRAYNAAMNWLQARSPSRKFMEVGTFIGQGMAIGMDNTSREIEESAEGMGESAMGGLSDILSTLDHGLDSELDYSPVITPVLDLSAIRDDASAIDNYLAAASIDPRLSRAQAGSIFESTQPEEETVDSTEEGRTEVTFKQYNYSPKALSTADIYRQTKNQVSTLRKGSFSNVDKRSDIKQG